MNNEEFDQQIKDVFEEHEFTFRPEHWDALSSRLDAAARQKRGALFLLPFLKTNTGIAAGLAVLISIMAGLFWNSREEQTQVAAHRPSVATPPPTAQTEQRLQPAPPAAAATTAVAPPEAAAAAIAATRPVRVRHRTTPSQAHLAQADLKQERNGETASSTPQVPETTQTLTATTTGSKSESPLLKEIPGSKNPATNVNIAYPDADFELQMRQELQSRTALGLTGGYNYGASNSGFALGINAKQRLSRHLYLEGDLAYVQNNAPSSTTNMSAVQFRAVENSFASPAIAASVKRIDVSDVSRLAYLQFSPGLGYQLGRKFQLGVGADIQQMLQQEKDMVVYIEDRKELKTLPFTDIGLVGKTHYHINDRLRAGVLYREGVQAALNSKYFNRRYVQFTFNYMLFQR